MPSPVNAITSMTYDSTWVTLERSDIKFSNVDGLVSTQMVGFPTTAFSARDPELGNQRQYSLSKNFNDPSNPPFGLLVNNSEKPAGVMVGLFESFADYDAGTNTATLHNGFSFSTFEMSAQDVSEFTLIYEEQESESESSNTLAQLNNQIHAVRDKSEMLAKLDTFKANIKTALVAGESDSYYKNHTGREFYKKLNNFGMHPYSMIGDPHDAGFRPLTVSAIKA